MDTFLTCSKCDGNLTGSASRSKTGARHFYYHCQNGCKERFRADTANMLFVQYLRSFKILEEVLLLYYKILEDVFRKDDIQRIKEIKTIDRNVEEFEKLINSVEDKYFENKINDIDYNRAKQRYTDQINELKKKRKELELHDSNFMKYVKYGFWLLKDLPDYYSQANIEVKHKIISSIFPEKIIFEEKKYRTQKVNEVLTLLTSNINHLGSPKKEKAVISDSLSYMASPGGIEPPLQE